MKVISLNLTSRIPVAETAEHCHGFKKWVWYPLNAL